MDKLNGLHLAQVLHAQVEGNPSFSIDSISIDSRRIGSDALFFALKGHHVDGSQFVGSAFRNGAVACVVSQDYRGTEAGVLLRVDDPLLALQRLAAWWRDQFTGKVIAVTGSNGKTIAKDALVKILLSQRYAAGSIGSFNSQLGVPLALCRIPKEVEIAVIEAGISAPDEMERLQAIIRPDFGILTNIGLAHVAAFGRSEQIAQEKMKLFYDLPADGWLLAPAVCPEVEPLLAAVPCPVYRFGAPNGQLPYVESRMRQHDGTTINIRFPDAGNRLVLLRSFSIESIANIEAAICAAWLCGLSADQICSALNLHEPAQTRMEIWRSPNGLTLINDSCSSDPISVQAALRTLQQMKQPGRRAVFAFGGMRELGDYQQKEHEHIGALAAEAGVDTLALFGGEELEDTAIGFHKLRPNGKAMRFEGVLEMAEAIKQQLCSGDTVLFKGPRGGGIGRAARIITDAMAYNRMMVDMGAIAENVAAIRRLVGPKCKILGMVKALAYGSHLDRLSTELQSIGLDMLGVSTADEGVQIRQAGVNLPILVMLCTPDEVDKAVQARMIPVVYSFDLVQPLAQACAKAGTVLPVHLKVDTGMGRTGVRPEQVLQLAEQVQATGWLKVAGLLSHFACADDPSEDEFTLQQIARFEQAKTALEQNGYTELCCHTAATAGAVRFPQAHYDMVRIGLGLYGCYPSEAVQPLIQLTPAVTLVSRITEVREYRKGDRIGYAGSFTVPRDGYRAGILPIGYNDGLPLMLSNVGVMMVDGKPTPIVGRISMDSCAIDLTAVPQAGVDTEVLIYGRHNGGEIRPEHVAELAGTHVWELLVRTGNRVQRVFVGE